MLNSYVSGRGYAGRMLACSHAYYLYPGSVTIFLHFRNEAVMKNILVIDAQGGGMGKQLISEIRKRQLDVHITAVGTNSAATAQLIKAGADCGATGENPVIVNSKNADYILGPIGIIAADSMLGEITPKMSKAVGKSSAKKILIPVNSCGIYVAGVANQSVKINIENAVDHLEKELT